jgi:ASC-1-like (ASCH) protein
VSIHVAILNKPYLDAILSGAKTVESRLTVTPKVPFAAIQPGERIFFKQSSGPFRAMAVAGRVKFYQGLRPRDVDDLKQRWQRWVGGSDAYWQSKRTSRYATMVELLEVEAADVGPVMAPSSGLAWFVLPEGDSPMLQVQLTAGALRNRYVTGTGLASYFGEKPVVLQLPDGVEVESDLYRGRRLRWRGWRPWFAQWDAKAGDAVRFVRVGPRRYRVDFRPSAP